MIEKLWEFLKDFREYKHVLTEVIPLALIAFYIRRQKSQLSTVVDRMSEQIATLGQKVDAARDVAEVALAGPPTGTVTGEGKTGADNWAEVSAVWQSMRNRIDQTIERIKRKDTREKYSRFKRYRYAQIVKSLQKDKMITEKTGLILQNMELKFLSLRARPKETAPADVKQFAAWSAELGGGLPDDGDPPQS